MIDKYIKRKIRSCELRKVGCSFTEIVKITSFPRTSIARWCKEIILTDEQKLKNKLKQHKGHKHNEVTKEKLRQIRKLRLKKLGYINTWEARKKISASVKKLNLFGSRNPCWRGGRTSVHELIRKSEMSIDWRKKIFQRDNYTCQECKQIGYKINAHHIVPFAKLYNDFLSLYNQFSPLEDKETLVRLSMTYKPFWDILNGTTLCIDCHKLKRIKKNA